MFWRHATSLTSLSYFAEAQPRKKMPTPPQAHPERQKSRNWCFTLNNYNDVDQKDIDTYAMAHPDVYIIYGKEIGENGTPHLQGYVHFPAPQAMSALRRFLHRAHMEKCKGTPEANIIYCKKGGDFLSYGDPPLSQAGKQQANAARFIELAKVGDFASIQEEFPSRYISSYRTMLQIATDHMVKPLDLAAPCGIWIYGESGTGKTTAARTEYGDYYSKCANKWWDGYQLEETVIIEDLDPNHKCLGHHLKLWCDKWSFPAEVKGGMRCLRPTRVIITSQYSIEELFSGEPATIAALKRRCKVIHMHKDLLYIPSNLPSLPATPGTTSTPACLLAQANERLHQSFTE